MYPWVNRIEDKNYPKVEFKDGDGLPLHGLYSTKKRIIETRKESP